MRRLFLIVYAASGAAALIYEVTWTRMLMLHIGHSTSATSTVLAALMGGLAAGSAAGGQYAARLTPRGALRGYVALEVAVAALAVVLPYELAALRPVLAAVYRDGDSDALFPAMRVMSSILLLAIPAAALGATFPVASRWFVQSAASAPRDAGRLYAVNTLGAATGAVLAGFVLLPIFGLSRTTWVGVALNLAAAAIAYFLSTRAEHREVNVVAPRRGSRRPGRITRSDGPTTLWMAAAAFGLSGFASLVLQVVWTRLLASILGPTTYAFSIVVAVFIAGMAAGSWIAAPIASRSRQPVLSLCFCLLASVAFAAAAATSIDWALLTMAEIARGAASIGGVLVKQTLLAAALLLPMTVAFGAVFPFAVVSGTRTDQKVAEDLGTLYAVNTTAAIGGALLGGFVFLPLMGLHDTIRTVTVVVASGACFLILAGHVTGLRRLVGVTVCTVVALTGLALPVWSEMLLSSGVYKYAYASPSDDLETTLTAGRLLYYREGASATVAVRESVGTTSLSIDGKVDASNAGDMLTQRLLAHLPLLLHAQPRQVAIIGLGSGVTLGSALTHPIARADVLEISPEVVEASSAFERENHRALADPRTRLIVGDGRSHVLLSRAQYDVIISEPSNPWMAGVASLFTREFFESAKNRLAPGGLLCQWAHTYDISKDDLRSIVATFLAVFPDGALWLVGEADVLLVGSNDRRGLSFEAIERHWDRPGVADDLLDVGARDPFALLSMFVAQGRGLARYAAGARLQTDDRGDLEFSGPRSIFGPRADSNASILRDVGDITSAPDVVRQAIANADASAWRGRGRMMLQAEAHDDAWSDFARAIEMDASDASAYTGLIRSSVSANRTRVAETLELLQRVAARTPGPDAELAISRVLASQHAIDDAIAKATELAKRFPNNIRVLEQLASVLADANDVERLEPVVVRMRRLAPESDAARYYAAASFFIIGRPDLAVPELESIVRQNPAHALAQNLLGASLAQLGDRNRARQAFEASLRADPRNPGTYTNLATLEVESGNPAAAAQRFAEALTLDPRSTAAREGLARLGGPRN